MKEVNTRKAYQEMLKEGFPILKLWKMKGSSVAKFVEAIEKKFNVLIHYRLGTIVKYNPELTRFDEVSLRFVLNHEILEVDGIYYDDRQFFVRTVGDQRIRRINLKVIQEVQLDGQILNVRELEF